MSASISAASFYMPIKGRALDLLVDSAVDPIPVILTPKAGHDRHA